MSYMTKPMKRRDVTRALRRSGCVIKSDKGRHTGIGKGLAKLASDVHDDVAMLVVTAPADQDLLARGWVSA